MPFLRTVGVLTFCVIISWLVTLGVIDVIYFFLNFGPICASIGGGCQ